MPSIPNCKDRRAEYVGPKVRKGAKWPKPLDECESHELTMTLSNLRADTLEIMSMYEDPIEVTLIQARGGGSACLWDKIHYCPIDADDPRSEDEVRCQDTHIKEMAADYGLTATQIVALYKAVPDRTDWEHQNVKAMYEAVFDEVPSLAIHVPKSSPAGATKRRRKSK